jgi:hypothetical protein
LRQALRAFVCNQVGASRAEPRRGHLWGQTVDCRIQLFQQLVGFRRGCEKQTLGNGGVVVTV